MVEIAIAVAIVAILGAIAFPMYTQYRDRTDVALAIRDITEMNLRLRTFIEDTGVIPSSLTVIGAAGRRDPWGNPYVYTALNTATIGQARKNKNLVPINTQFDLYSLGKDGQSATPITAKKSQDDIILASDGRFIGRASDYR